MEGEANPRLSFTLRDENERSGARWRGKLQTSTTPSKSCTPSCPSALWAGLVTSGLCVALLPRLSSMRARSSLQSKNR